MSSRGISNSLPESFSTKMDSGEPPTMSPSTSGPLSREIVDVVEHPSTPSAMPTPRRRILTLAQEYTSTERFSSTHRMTIYRDIAPHDAASARLHSRGLWRFRNTCPPTGDMASVGLWRAPRLRGERRDGFARGGVELGRVRRHELGRRPSRG